MSHFIVNIAMLIIMTAFLTISKAYFRRRYYQREDSPEDRRDITAPRQSVTDASTTRPRGHHLLMKSLRHDANS